MKWYGLTSVVVQDANTFSQSLGLNLNNLTTKAAKGQFGEAAGQSWARSNGLTPFFEGGDTLGKGFDAIYKDSAGNFVIQESKWISSNTNVGIGSLSNTTSGRQLSERWMFGPTANDGALGRTTGLSPDQRVQVFNAFLAGKIKTQLVVTRPRHVGSGITQRLANDSTFGKNGSDKLDDIVIIEVPINP